MPPQGNPDKLIGTWERWRKFVLALGAVASAIAFVWLGVPLGLAVLPLLIAAYLSWREMGASEQADARLGEYRPNTLPHYVALFFMCARTVTPMLFPEGKYLRHSPLSPTAAVILLGMGPPDEDTYHGNQPSFLPPTRLAAWWSLLGGLLLGCIDYFANPYLGQIVAWGFMPPAIVSALLSAFGFYAIFQWIAHVKRIQGDHHKVSSPKPMPAVMVHQLKPTGELKGALLTTLIVFVIMSILAVALYLNVTVSIVLLASAVVGTSLVAFLLAGSIQTLRPWRAPWKEDVERLEAWAVRWSRLVAMEVAPIPAIEAKLPSQEEWQETNPDEPWEPQVEMANFFIPPGGSYYDYKAVADGLRNDLGAAFVVTQSIPDDNESLSGKEAEQGVVGSKLFRLFWTSKAMDMPDLLSHDVDGWLQDVGIMGLVMPRIEAQLGPAEFISTSFITKPDSAVQALEVRIRPGVGFRHSDFASSIPELQRDLGVKWIRLIRDRRDASIVIVYIGAADPLGAGTKYFNPAYQMRETIHAANWDYVLSRAGIVGALGTPPMQSFFTQRETGVNRVTFSLPDDLGIDDFKYAVDAIMNVSGNEYVEVMKPKKDDKKKSRRQKMRTTKAKVGEEEEDELDRQVMVLAARKDPLDNMFKFSTYRDRIIHPREPGKVRLKWAAGIAGDGEIAYDDFDGEEAVHLLIAGETGSGKALAVDTLVLTPIGWRKIGDIKAGEYVVSPNNQSVRVLRATTTFTPYSSHRVRLSNGDTITASDSHLWTVTDHRLTGTATIANSTRREAISSVVPSEVAVPSPVKPKRTICGSWRKSRAGRGLIETSSAYGPALDESGVEVQSRYRINAFAGIPDTILAAVLRFGIDADPTGLTARLIVPDFSLSALQQTFADQDYDLTTVRRVESTLGTFWLLESERLQPLLNLVGNGVRRDTLLGIERTMRIDDAILASQIMADSYEVPGTQDRITFCRKDFAHTLKRRLRAVAQVVSGTDMYESFWQDDRQHDVTMIRFQSFDAQTAEERAPFFLAGLRYGETDPVLSRNPDLIETDDPSIRLGLVRQGYMPTMTESETGVEVIHVGLTDYDRVVLTMPTADLLEQMDSGQARKFLSGVFCAHGSCTGKDGDETFFALVPDTDGMTLATLTDLVHRAHMQETISVESERDRVRLTVTDTQEAASVLFGNSDLLAQQVYWQDTFSPSGEHVLPTPLLSAELNVSRDTLRKALRGRTAEGFLRGKSMLVIDGERMDSHSGLLRLWSVRTAGAGLDALAGDDIKSPSAVRIATTRELAESPLRYVIGDTVTIQSVERAPNTDMRCLTVDSEDQCFIVGRHRTVTHNSVFVESMICQIASNNSPEDVELYLLEPKIGLHAFRDLDVTKGFADSYYPTKNFYQNARDMLKALYEEMQERNELFLTYINPETGVPPVKLSEARDLAMELGHTSENPHPLHKPYVFIFIEECATVFADAPKEDAALQAEALQYSTHLALKARAAGMFLICMTQYPTNASIPSRIRTQMRRVGLTCRNAFTSNIVIDQNGLETLKGKGYCMLKMNGENDFRRARGFLVEHGSPKKGQRNDLLDVLNKLPKNDQAKERELAQDIESGLPTGKDVLEVDADALSIGTFQDLYEKRSGPKMNGIMDGAEKDFDVTEGISSDASDGDIDSIIQKRMAQRNKVLGGKKTTASASAKSASASATTVKEKTPVDPALAEPTGERRPVPRRRRRRS